MFMLVPEDVRGAGNLTMIEEAIHDGAEVRGEDPELYRSTALHYAAGRGQVIPDALPAHAACNARSRRRVWVARWRL